MAFNFPHSPVKQKGMVHKQVDILLCPMNCKKQQLVELKDLCTFLLTLNRQKWWTDKGHTSFATLASGIGHLITRCQVRWPENAAGFGFG